MRKYRTSDRGEEWERHLQWCMTASQGQALQYRVNVQRQPVEFCAYVFPSRNKTNLQTARGMGRGCLCSSAVVVRDGGGTVHMVQRETDEHFSQIFEWLDKAILLRLNVGDDGDIPWPTLPTNKDLSPCVK